MNINMTDPLSRQDIAEGAPYDDPDHGRVVVALVDDDTVYYEQPPDRPTQTALMHNQPLDTFRRIVDPLPQTLNLPGATATTDTSLGGR